MNQNINSQFSVLNTINQVDGFDPSQLTVDYVDLTTQEKRKRLAVGQDHTIGLRSDGTVVATGRDNANQCDVNNWKNIRLPQ